MTEAPAASGGSVGRAGMVLASGTLVSRLFGFVNAALLSYAIGATGVGANAFAVANSLPNSIFLIISGGLLSAVFVPQIVKAGTQSDGGAAFVNRLLTLAGAIFLAVTVLAVLAAPLLVGLYVSPKGQFAGAGMTLAIEMAYLCLPQIFFYAIYSLVGEVLNARGVYGPVTWVPVINNVVAILAIVVFAALFGVDPAHQDPTTWTVPQVAVLAGGATLGVAGQFIGLLFFWRRTGIRYRPDFHWRGAGLGTAGRTAGWTFGMIVVNQLGGVVQSLVATTAGRDDPSVRVLQIAWLLFVLPHSLVTMSITTPTFTRMSTSAHAGDLAAVRRDFSESLRVVALLIAGSAAALAAAAPALGVIFTRTHADAFGVAGVLLAYLVGLIPFALLFLVQRTFFALGDSRTPFFTQVLQTAIFIIGALLALDLPDARLAAGIALATSLSEVVQLALAVILLRRRLGHIDGGRILRRLGTFMAATIPAAAIGVLVLWALGGIPGAEGFALSGKLGAIVSSAAVGAVTLAAYLGVTALARVPETRLLTGVAQRLLRR